MVVRVGGRNLSRAVQLITPFDIDDYYYDPGPPNHCSIPLVRWIRHRAYYGTVYMIFHQNDVRRIILELDIYGSTT